MKTKPCPSCENPVSPKAESCPQCGHPLSPEPGVIEKVGAFAVICVIVFIGFSILFGGDESETDAAETVVTEVEETCENCAGSRAANDAEKPFSRRPDLTEHYAAILPAETRFEKNIVPTTVTVFGPSTAIAACKAFDNTYKANDILDALSEGAVTLEDAMTMMNGLDCIATAPGSWGEAVRAYINSALLVDFQYIYGVDPDVLKAIDSMYWVAAIPMADIATHERAIHLATAPFESSP